METERDRDTERQRDRETDTRGSDHRNVRQIISVTFFHHPLMWPRRGTFAWSPASLPWQTHTAQAGTETAFRQVHANGRPLACISKKSTSRLGVRGQLMRSPAWTDPKRSILRGQSSRQNYRGEFWSWPPSTWRFSTGRSLITMVKETVKENFEKAKKLKPVRMSHWSDCDENAIECEIACYRVKRANVVMGLL